MQKKWKTSHFGQWKGWVTFKDRLFSLNVSFEFKNHLGEQGMVQWWERSPPINVAWVQILASTPCVGWVSCWFSPLLREVFLWVLWFFTNISKFQFDQESGRWRTTLWMCYLQIIIYLFILSCFWQGQLTSRVPNSCLMVLCQCTTVY